MCDGNGHSCDDFALARYDADGDLDPTFGHGGKVVTHFVAESRTPSSSIAEGLVIEANGTIDVAGPGAGYDFAMARYTTRGRLKRNVLTDFGSG